MNILTLNKIAKIGLNELPKDFAVSDNCENPDGIILRSFVMHDMAFGDKLLAVARAGAGVNNVPVDKLGELGIVAFNTPGANANAVKELVIAALLLSSRKIHEGINWIQSKNGESGIAKTVEAGKADFGGTEITGKTIGIIGFGAIGKLVAKACHALGMNVLACDPYADEMTCRENNAIKSDMENIYTLCDYITIHAPLNSDTKEMFNAEVFGKVRKGVKLINAARAELVSSAAVKAALENGTVGCYVTDFPTDELLGVKNLITIPHLGASTEESEDNCAIMAAAQLREYLLHGNIVNSVNYPTNIVPVSGKKRVCVLAKYDTDFTAIENVLGTGSRVANKQYSYAIYEVLEVTDNIIENVKKMNGVIRVRVL